MCLLCATVRGDFINGAHLRVVGAMESQGPLAALPRNQGGVRQSQVLVRACLRQYLLVSGARRERCLGVGQLHVTYRKCTAV